MELGILDFLKKDDFPALFKQHKLYLPQIDL